MPRYSQVSIRQFKDKTKPEFDDNFNFASDIGGENEDDASSSFDNFEFASGEKGSSEDTIPTETVTFNYEEIKVTYREDAVLDFALTGDDDFSPGATDDFLF
ncbi:hypothetical protein K1718_06950 [Roseibium porphyridii]|uniref:Uncharacterized protein n=1 Tax=Roseibium porphyridii TaxID=2866279 RepID=A0ABY8FCU3_9HYPH|nr:hypothetical protein [Roseibium sp. KMA01]WFE91085.1 hypothetical protein K1718_06950 [Roseibium sp. KMA01]